MSAPDHLGDYEIVEEIGRGGFGVVHKARQISLDRPVALKVLFEHRVHTPEELARFEREARAAARLDHNAIVQVYAWGEEQGTFYIAQKLVGRGRTLADSLANLKEQGEHPKGYFRQIAERLVCVAEALQHAHDHGIVHRDVKPSNVLLDEQGRPFLGDFGLAKLEDGLELSRTGDFAGSPYYMSPEQADSKRGEVDHRADIYSLGVTLYELLTLQPPFSGQSAHEIIRKILSEEPPRPSRIQDRTPLDLETICLKAMEKGRSRRYQSAQEMADDLQAFLDGEPISAVPISTVSRIFRKARRHRAGVGIVVLIAALLGLATLLKKEAGEGQRQEERASASRAGVEATTQLRQGADEVVSEKITEALQQSDTDRAGELVDFKKQVDTWLDAGQSLVLEGLPEIVDSESLSTIGSSLQEEGIYSGILRMAQALQAEGDASEGDDPRLAAAANWLLAAKDLAARSEALDLPVGGLLGLETTNAELSLGDLAGTGASGESGPLALPTGPGGALEGLGDGPARRVAAPLGLVHPGSDDAAPADNVQDD